MSIGWSALCFSTSNSNLWKERSLQGLEGDTTYMPPPQCHLPLTFLQECLQRFGDSLQEMVNYHTVSPMGRVGYLLLS